MKSFTLLIFAGLVCTTIAVKAEETKYKVSDIPESLSKNVNIVIREDVREFKILAKNKAFYHVFRAITILNAKGGDYAQEVIGYDKIRKITEFKGTAYDATGNVIKRLKKNEIYDQSAFDGYSIYSDNRLKAANLSQGQYPYTVEFEYEVEYSNLFQLPHFQLLPDEQTSVQHAIFKLTYPSELKPRFLSTNVKDQPFVSQSYGVEITFWEFKDVLPVKEEAYSPDYGQLVPRILVGPSAFDFDGYEGTMHTWDQFGQWIGNLNRGRDILPPATEMKIKELTQNLKTDEEKVAAIYKFVQEKTRYVSIQLGIGGFQPFEATVVDQTGYGDCKALSNYTISLLKAAGIKANYVLIDAGPDYSFEPEFVSSQFNHAIVAVPGARDTLWLECTSQTNPLGYMGRFTGDRKALMITDQGAKVVNTISYEADQNTQNRQSEVIIEKTGDASAKVKTVYAGLQYENGGVYRLLSDQFDEQKKWIQNNTDIPSFDLEAFKMSGVKDKIPSATVEAQLKLRKFATVSGKRLLFSPNLMNRSTYLPPKLDGERKTQVVRRMGYVDQDTIHYQLPDNIYPEFVPEPIKINSRFGEYEATIKLDEKGVTYIRRLRMKKGIFPPESYQELTDFYKSINKADNMKLVFLNKT